MRTLWWITVMAFFLGMGIGTSISGFQEKRGEELPVFSSQPEYMSPFAPEESPTLPTAAQIGSSQTEETVFPCPLQFTSLVVEKLSSYEGPWLQDGSEEHVVGVAALLVRNTGTIGIEYARISLVQNGQELIFDATYIPPKGTILLLEDNKQPYSDAPVTNCRCRSVIPGNFDMAQRTVRIEQEGLCTLKVTNLTDTPMAGVRIFYKHHDGQADLYVGGITYSAVIPELLPGQTKEITPYRYASGYALVVAVVEE